MEDSAHFLVPEHRSCPHLHRFTQEQALTLWEMDMPEPWRELEPVLALCRRLLRFRVVPVMEAALVPDGLPAWEVLERR